MTSPHDPAASHPGAGQTSAANVVLDERLDITHAAALKAQLLEVLERNDDVDLDAGDVTLVDTAALQVLLAFVRGCAARGMQVRWNRRSEAFEAAARLLGMADLLALEPAGAGCSQSRNIADAADDAGQPD